jgi:hypothetical protein
VRGWEEKEVILIELGLDPGDARQWAEKRQTLKRNTASKPYKCLLTFEQYVRLAVEAGLSSPSQVGRVRGSYQMARLGDIGNYEVGNCRFILQSENIAEKKVNGGTARAAEKKTGRTKETCPGLASISRKASERMLGRRKETHPSVASQAEKISKHFRIISPSGEVFIGKNLEEFCKTHGIVSRGQMSKVCNQKKVAHMGWTGRYITKEEYLAEVSIHSESQ